MSGETAKIEFKEFVDFGERSSALKFIKEVVALANAGGGIIRVGIGDDGTPTGRPIRPVDAADLCNRVDAFISPDHLELSVEPAHAGSEYLVHVPPVARPPLVMVKDGTVGEGKAQTSIFRKGDVFVRTGTKAQAASRTQYLDWIEEIRTAERELLLRQVQFVTSAPAAATLQFVAGDEEFDEPGALLARSSRAYRRNPEKLLTGNELLLLLSFVRTLSPSDAEWRVLVQSALRKKATLWFWLARWQPSATEVHHLLCSAISGKDRDRSDAGNAIVEVAAVFLPDGDFRDVVHQLETSTYQHFKNAVPAGSDRPSYVARLDSRCGELDNRGTDEILREASELSARALDEGTNRSIANQLMRLGFNLFRQTDIWRSVLIQPAFKA